MKGIKEMEAPKKMKSRRYLPYPFHPLHPCEFFHLFSDKLSSNSGGDLFAQNPDRSQGFVVR